VLTPDTFDQFHNTEKKLSDRQLMLAGEWPTGGCEYCGDVERAGGSSDRQFHLQIPNMYPPELDADPTAIEVTPRIVEVYLDNTCNMSCVYCWDGFSSRIQQENIKFGPFSQAGLEIKNVAVRNPDHDALTDKFWLWMEANYSEIRRLHILGGEPFFQRQFETCLAFLETHSNPELEFNIVSNLKINPAKLANFVQRIKQLVDTNRIKRFDLTCSIDCWGAEQEYIRYGIDLEEWKKNFDYVANESWITLNINQTLTVLGMKTVKDLLQYVNQHRQHREIGHYFMACVSPTYLYPGIMGQGYFDHDFEQILTVMPDDTWQHKNARAMMEGLQLEFNTKEVNCAELEHLNIFLNEIDRRRNTSWRTTFPWLVKELEHVL